jgi:hypothetical protein
MPARWIRLPFGSIVAGIVVLSAVTGPAEAEVTPSPDHGDRVLTDHRSHDRSLGVQSASSALRIAVTIRSIGASLTASDEQRGTSKLSRGRHASAA